MNLYHEHFPDALEKYTRFPMFTLLFSNSYDVSIERLYAAKSSAAFFSSLLIALLQSLDRFLFKRFSLIAL